jgi:hypothetical protein
MNKPLITLYALTNEKYDLHVRALLDTSACLPVPHKMLLISPARPEGMPDSIEWRNMPQMATWDYWKFNAFLYRWPALFVETDFGIVVQHDGFAQHREHWTDEFLEYDYVAAPFPIGISRGRGRMGSGGFCLRSKKLMEACRKIELRPGILEDSFITLEKRAEFESFGCRFAPVPLGVRFSIDLALEDYPGWTTDMSWGFHDNHGPYPKGKNKPFVCPEFDNSLNLCDDMGRR